jgi:hypothetical protein
MLIGIHGVLFNPLHNRLQFHRKFFQSLVTIWPETNDRCQVIVPLHKMIALTFCGLERSS